MQQPPMQHPPTNQQSTGAGDAAGELRSGAQQIGSKAADRLHSEVDARKGSAAAQAKSVSNVMQNAAGQLDEGAPAWLRSAFQQGAEQIERVADTLEQKDSRQILNEVQSFARQRPALFLGACAAVGFAASRVLKAGGEQQSSQQLGNTEFDQSQPWGDGEAEFGRSDNFGQQFDEASQSRPFIAAGDSGTEGFGQGGASQSGGASADDPLILGAGGAGGSELLGRGDDR
ncbi:MAG TPA: hypothetical protein VGB39_00485 [Sphingomicrobium sp.]|jgi:ElaB/YqjD/DUF883 family membrane-anchored ribosome-binding protein